MSIIEDAKYLKSVDDIKDYFDDMGADYFDCGQGYFQNEADVFVKIGSDYFVVHIEAEIIGDKQDRGDRLYYVESITDVSYKSISIDEIKTIHNKDITAKIAYHQNMIEKLTNELV